MTAEPTRILEFFAYETVGATIPHAAPMIRLPVDEHTVLLFNEEDYKAFWEKRGLVTAYIELHCPGLGKMHWEVAWLLALRELGLLGDTALYAFRRHIPVWLRWPPVDLVGIIEQQQSGLRPWRSPPCDLGMTPDPKWFEVSNIFRPADRIAFPGDK